MKDWDLLRFLLAIHRQGGLSGAARVLGVTHATVSRKLDRAEEELGAKLFIRLQSGLTPTETGAAVVARAEAVEAEIVALSMSLYAEDEGPLSITAPPLLMQTHLAADLRSFSTAHPRIQLSILSDNRVFNLHRREADIAIRVTREPAESLWGRKLVEQRSGYFATADFIRRHQKVLESGAGPMPVISFTAWRSPVPTSLTGRLPEAFVAAVCDDMLAAVGLVKAGLGLTRMPFFVGRSEPELQRIETLPTESYAPIWLLTHPDLRRTAKVRLMMEHLAQSFKQSSDQYNMPDSGSVRMIAG